MTWERIHCNCNEPKKISREIKFRVWSNRQKKMLHKVLAGTEFSVVYDEERKDWFEFGTLDGDLMQHTGLKDRTGKEIYEGDILRIDEDSFGVVKWGVGCFYFEDDIDGRTALEDTYVDRYAVVLGNIYENPELIEERNADS